MTDLTPRRIVAHLDRYIIGQDAAKRAVAVAIRNRWRRAQLEEDLRRDVLPKNILMVGPTGVGKTEIARRLADLVQAPFLKVEATKYTEVGYHGRDVESMVRDLVEVGIQIVRQEVRRRTEGQAQQMAEEALLDILYPATRRPAAGTEEEGSSSTRERLREKLRAGDLDTREVELEVEEKSASMMQVFSNAGLEEYGIDFPNLLGNLAPGRRRRQRMSVAEARRVLLDTETEKLLNQEEIKREAVCRTQEQGILFIDEMDKVAGSEGGKGPDVSRQGVQRDLLPLVEGTAVATRHGVVHTDHILFIAAGAFHGTKPSDLVPELQGRFPIRVELSSLGEEEFVRILTEPRNALVRQYEALLATEGVTLVFEEDAIREIAKVVARVNAEVLDIGARRLHTVMEKLLEEVSFDAPERAGQRHVVGAGDVRSRLEGILGDEDLTRYVL